MQLGTVHQSRRIDLILGDFSILDFFDRVPFGIDPRQGLFSLAYLTYPAWDFASDSRGYSWGGVAELYWDDWAFRVGRISALQEPNQLATDFRLWLYYGDELEIEHRHKLFGMDGIVRLLGYHNHVDAGSFNDAIAAFQANPQVDNAKNCAAAPNLNGFNYGSINATAPDLCWARKPNDKEASDSTSSSTSRRTSACSFGGCTPMGRPRSTPTPRPTVRFLSACRPREPSGIAHSTSRESPQT